MELFRALAVLAEPPTKEVARVAEALGLGVLPEQSEYTDLFVFQAYPYASVYLGAEGMLGGEARDRIAGFWRALGSEPPSEPDHLSVLLAALATLPGEPPSVRGALYWEHIASWMPPYLATLRRVGGAVHPPRAGRVSARRRATAGDAAADRRAVSRRMGGARSGAVRGARRRSRPPGAAAAGPAFRARAPPH